MCKKAFFGLALLLALSCPLFSQSESPLLWVDSQDYLVQGSTLNALNQDLLTAQKNLETLNQQLKTLKSDFETYKNNEFWSGVLVGVVAFGAGSAAGAITVLALHR